MNNSKRVRSVNSTKCIRAIINGINLKEQAKNNNIAYASQSSRLATEIKHFLKRPHVKKLDVYQTIKHHRLGSDISNHIGHWKFAIQSHDKFINALSFNAKTPNVTSKFHLQPNTKITSVKKQSVFSPIRTVLKTDSISKALEIVQKQQSLTNYESALLVYNTIVSKYNLTEK